MNEFLYSARSDLRLHLRLEALLPARAHLGHTEDVGAGGCRLRGPVRLHTGAHLRLLFEGRGAASSPLVDATVVWRQDEPEWRHGLAFTAGATANAAGWFDALLQSHLDLLDGDRVPDRIHPDSRLRIARATREPLSPEEAALLDLAAGRPSVGELLDSLGQRWSSSRRALYSLLDRGLVTLEPVS
ncbi:MAG: PilZ domain-containing protein [Deltaproteobacteria bacterium]|nr:PilZ domain-containing protein [Deltaproteobacteria bacterium]